MRDAGRIGVSRGKVETKRMAPAAKKPRKATAYNKEYSRQFAKFEKKNKKKNGGWKQNGFRNTQKAAHKAAKKKLGLK